MRVQYIPSGNGKYYLSLDKERCFFYYTDAKTKVATYYNPYNKYIVEFLSKFPDARVCTQGDQLWLFTSGEQIWIQTKPTKNVLDSYNEHLKIYNDFLLEKKIDTETFITKHAFECGNIIDHLFDETKTCDKKSDCVEKKEEEKEEKDVTTCDDDESESDDDDIKKTQMNEDELIEGETIDDGVNTPVQRNEDELIEGETIDDGDNTPVQRNEDELVEDETTDDGINNIQMNEDELVEDETTDDGINNIQMNEDELIEGETTDECGDTPVQRNEDELIEGETTDDGVNNRQKNEDELIEGETTDDGSDISVQKRKKNKHYDKDVKKKKRRNNLTHFNKKCNKCNRMFKSKGGYKNHIDNDICERKLRKKIDSILKPVTPENTPQNQNNIRNDVDISSSTYSCTSCNHTFNSIVELTIHEDYSHSKYYCCGQFWNTEKEFTDHNMIQHNFVCAICRRTYPEQEKLTNHIKYNHAVPAIGIMTATQVT